MALYLLVEATDGYRVVFALPELDPAFKDRAGLLADRRDGQPLAAAEGPLRLVVPGEKRHARWVRQALSGTIRQAPMIRIAGWGMCWGWCYSAAVASCREPGIPELTGRCGLPTNSGLIDGDHHVAGFDHGIDLHPGREMQPFGRGFGNDRDDFSPTGQLHRHLRIHGAGSDVFDTAFQSITRTDLH